MRKIELCPAEMDADSVKMYKFMDWFVRRHRRLIEDRAENIALLMNAYGPSLMEEMKELFEIGQRTHKGRTLKNSPRNPK